jgi:hypothetical protein
VNRFAVSRLWQRKFQQTSSSCCDSYRTARPAEPALQELLSIRDVVYELILK